MSEAKKNVSGSGYMLASVKKESGGETMLEARKNELRIDLRAAAKKIKSGGAAMSKRLLMAGLAVMMAVGLVLAADNADVTVLVTPNVAANISISPASYDFGTLDLSVSSNSASGSVCPVIQNDGTVGVSLEKTVTDDDAWTLSTAAGYKQFVLWAMTSADTTEGNRPAVADYLDGASYDLSVSSFSTTLSNYTLLTDDSQTQELLDPSGQANDSAALWFRLDMPSSVDSGTQRSFTVNIRAVAE